DAARPRCGPVPEGRAGEEQHVARLRPRQGRRQSLPDRPSRRVQRADPAWGAVGGRDGAGGGRRAAPLRWRGGRDQIAGGTVRRQFAVAPEDREELAGPRWWF